MASNLLSNKWMGRKLYYQTRLLVIDSCTFMVQAPFVGEGIFYSMTCLFIYHNTITRKEGEKMVDDVNVPKGRQQFVWVKDNAGNEYACPVSVLKKPEDLTEEERKACVDDASVPQAYAGG